MIRIPYDPTKDTPDKPNEKKVPVDLIKVAGNARATRAKQETQELKEQINMRKNQLRMLQEKLLDLEETESSLTSLSPDELVAKLIQAENWSKITHTFANQELGILFLITEPLQFEKGVLFGRVEKDEDYDEEDDDPDYRPGKILEKKYVFGRFIISLNFAEEERRRGVMVQNIDYEDHPFIDNGEMCFGNVSKQSEEAWQQGEYGKVLDFIFDILYSRKDGMGYHSWSDWQENKQRRTDPRDFVFNLTSTIHHVAFANYPEKEESEEKNGWTVTESGFSTVTFSGAPITITGNHDEDSSFYTGIRSATTQAVEMANRRLVNQARERLAERLFNEITEALKVEDEGVARERRLRIFARNLILQHSNPSSGLHILDWLNPHFLPDTRTDFPYLLAELRTRIVDLRYPLEEPSPF